MMVNSLAGTYRVSNREMCVLCALRSHKKLRLSMNQIARVMSRSRSTVHEYVKQIKRDNRMASPTIRHNNKVRFEFMLGSLRLKMKMYLKGFFNDFEEALDCRSVPVRTLDAFFLNENTFDEEEEDPA